MSKKQLVKTQWNKNKNDGEPFHDRELERPYKSSKNGPKDNIQKNVLECPKNYLEHPKNVLERAKNVLECPKNI